MNNSLLSVRHLKKYYFVGRSAFFRKGKQVLKAVDDVSFSIRNGETLALVGESGCGKSTLGRLILRLIEPTAGSVEFMGQDIYRVNLDELQTIRKFMQIIFQDPFASLNPRKSVRQILSQPYILHENVQSIKELEERVSELLEIVGLTPSSSYIDRYPHEFSGGQRQRIGIARAIALKPKFIVADEPVSSLDLSIRAQILNLIKDLQTRFNLTCLFITHDLSVVRSIATRVMVMYLGKIVELAPVVTLFANPKHPYTKALLLATPIPNPRKARHGERLILRGEITSPLNLSSGCYFHPRCPQAMAECILKEPSLGPLEEGHFVACFSNM